MTILKCLSLAFYKPKSMKSLPITLILAVLAAAPMDLGPVLRGRTLALELKVSSSETSPPAVLEESFELIEIEAQSSTSTEAALDAPPVQISGRTAEDSQQQDAVAV
jgi:hypothetical protein